MPSCLSSEINSRNLQPFVPKLSADDLSCCGILGSLCIAQRPDGWPSRCWCRPPRQSLITALRVLMAKAMHMTQTRRLALSIVDVPLLDEGLVCRDQ